MQTLQGSSSGAEGCSSAGTGSTPAHEPSTQGKKANFNIHTEKSSEMLRSESLQSTGIISPDYKEALNLALRSSSNRWDMGGRCDPTDTPRRTPAAGKDNCNYLEKIHTSDFSRCQCSESGITDPPRSPLCHAALPFHSDEGFLLLASPGLG